MTSAAVLRAIAIGMPAAAIAAPATFTGSSRGSDITRPAVGVATEDYCSAPDFRRNDLYWFVLLDVDRHEAFRQMIEGFTPKDDVEHAAVRETVDVLASTADTYETLAHSLQPCNYTVFDEHRCTTKSTDALQTRNPRLDGETLSFTVLDSVHETTIDYVIPERRYSEARVTTTDAEGTVTDLAFRRHADGTETLNGTSSDGVRLSVLEYADCSGSYSSTGPSAGDRRDITWTSPDGSAMSMTWKTCSAEGGCAAGSIP